MTIKQKLLLPVGAQCLIFLLAVYFMIGTYSLFSETLSSREEFNTVSCNIRSLAYKVEDFYQGMISYEVLDNEFHTAIEQLQRTHFSGQEDIIHELEAIRGEHASLEELVARNDRVLSELEALTDFSFQQSNHYIESTIEKWIEEDDASSSSLNERSMILNANLNNISNFTTKLMLQGMKSDLHTSEELLNHLDKSIRNAETAEKELAGSALAEFPQKARETNQQMKGLVQLYQENARQFAEARDIASTTIELFLSNFSERESSSLKILSDRILRLFWQLGGALFCLTTFFMLVNLSLYRSLSRSFHSIRSVADDIVSGNLAINIVSSGRDEIDDLMGRLGRMLQHLNTLVAKVQRSGAQLSSSAMQLSATTGELDGTMVSHLESMNQILLAVGEISSVMTQLAATISSVALMSKDTAASASRGQEDLAHMKAAVGQMETASKSISNRLETIHEKAENITSVVVTITKVAEQTNLLSLNAAIEAEKAGEFGRGFTVVAREIRRLADQTAVATLDIESMVQEMQRAVSSGMMEMGKFINDVRQSAEIVGKVSVQFARIIEQVQALAPNFEQVNVAIGQQSTNAQHINSTVLHLSEELQETRSALSESYMAVEQLNEISRALQVEVARFTVSEDEEDEPRETSESGIKLLP